MNLRSRPAIIIGVAVLALGVGGAAFATANRSGGGGNAPSGQAEPGIFLDSSSSGTASSGSAGMDYGADHVRPFAEAAASYLGLSVSELTNRLQNGQSLADVAKAQGKSVAGLKQAVLDAARKELQQRVDAGDLTAQQRSQILDMIGSKLDEIVNHAGLPEIHRGGQMGPGGPGGFGGPMAGGIQKALGTAADYLGLSTSQLESRLQNGQSLADVAKAQGKSVAGLKQALLDAAAKDLQQRVDAGDMTAQQRTQILGFLRSNVDAILNGQIPHFGDGDHDFGPPGGFGQGGSMGPPPGFGPPGGSGGTSPQPQQSTPSDGSIA